MLYKIFKRVLNLSKKNKKKIIIGSLFNILKAFSMGTMFFGVFYIFLNINNLNLDYIKNSFYIIFVSVLFRFIFQWLIDIYITAAGYDVFKDYRLEMADKLKNAQMSYFSENNLGKIQGVMTTTITSLEGFSMMTISNMLVSFSMTLFMIIMLFYNSLILGMISLIGISVAFYILSIINKRASLCTKELEIVQNNLVIKTIEYIRGITVLRSFNKVGTKKDGVTKVFKEKREMDYKQEKQMAGMIRLYQFTFKITSCFIVLGSCYMFANRIIDATYTSIFIVASFFIYSELENMGDSVFLARRTNNQLDLLEDTMNIPLFSDGGEEFNSNDFSIEFENVNFSYENENALNNINIKLNSNETTAIVGTSGSGKTTLCLLMSRFFDVKSGKIKIGDKDIRDIKYDSLMKQISMVFQDVYLFNDTIENNIRFANKNATDNQIVDACKKACCHEFISNLPNGYKTIIGEGGSTLSGGEKQRISIARAIIKDSPIIILDEMTSSVDLENEHLIVKAMKNLTKNKTVVTIAHKIATIKNANKIIVMDKGFVVQEGTHDSLKNIEGIYNNFIKAREQSKNWSLVKDYK
ncbi:MAG: ABC transporter ATP-binding protein/permease [Peptostreptococcaceae bacterium]|jgi:ATP-binding cassette subfamily B protein|nr:ABC transporter ATP-binding protein/permease [Peptostreptococcaceae bacterium]